MKRITAIVLFAVMAALLCACSAASKPEFDKDGWRVPLDSAVTLTHEFDEALLDKIVPKSETEYYVDLFKGKGEDYIDVLSKEFESIRADYAERYGDDWTVSYEVTEVTEKDEEGIRKYKEFDSYFFKTYNINTDDISAVTFVKVRVHIEGSKGSNDKDKTLQCFCLNGEWYSFYAIRLGVKL